MWASASTGAMSTLCQTHRSSARALTDVRFGSLADVEARLQCVRGRHGLHSRPMKQPKDPIVG